MKAVLILLGLMTSAYAAGPCNPVVQWCDAYYRIPPPSPSSVIKKNLENRQLLDLYEHGYVVVMKIKPIRIDKRYTQIKLSDGYVNDCSLEIDNFGQDYVEGEIRFDSLPMGKNLDALENKSGVRTLRTSTWSLETMKFKNLAYYCGNSQVSFELEKKERE